MLTKELFVTRTTKGVMKPSYLDPEDKEWKPFAAWVVDTMATAAGEAHGTLEETLQNQARSQKTAARVKRARGLIKTALDKVEVEEVDPAAAELRETTFVTAAEVLAQLEDDADEASFDSALSARVGELEALRARLYADLPTERKVTEVPGWSATELIDRYNLGLAQGLLLYAKRLSVTLADPDVVELRGLLQRLKWCRLVAHIERKGEGLRLEVEGPAAVLDSARKYGLQLAQFLSAVLRLSRFVVEAEVALPRKKPALLRIDHRSGLVSSLGPSRGHVPEEVKTLQDRLPKGWTLAASQGLRSVGPRGTCVPDFELEHAEHGQVAVELFHSWHAHALRRRLQELADLDDPKLVLGVDKKILKKDPELAAQVEGRTAAFSFNGFPTARALASCLAAV